MSFSIRRCPATVEMLDEHCEKLAASVKAKKRAQTEREVEELTRDTMQIQALFRGHNTTVSPSNDRRCHDSISVISRPKFGRRGETRGRGSLRHGQLVQRPSSESGRNSGLYRNVRNSLPSNIKKSTILVTRGAACSAEAGQGRR